MKKIFKYTFEGEKTEIPKNSEIIRMDHVDDGFYDGYFVWAIVDTDDLEETREVGFDISKTIDYTRTVSDFTYYYKQELKVKEKQRLKNFKPKVALEDDGVIFVKGMPEQDSEYEIVFFKTGQEIDVPIEEYKYIGICRIWIIQELGLYCFVKKIK